MPLRMTAADSWPSSFDGDINLTATDPLLSPHGLDLGFAPTSTSLQCAKPADEKRRANHDQG